MADTLDTLDTRRLEPAGGPAARSQAPPAQPSPGQPAPDAPVGGRRRWPLLLIGASAGTATWSGWVGLGELTGFGVVHPLPGIWDHLTLNTAITLPVGVEAYAVYALAVATDPRPLTRLARRWAWASAGGALLLGVGGQIAYHLLAARDVTAAPGWVVALVSSLPVLVLGAASLLWHLAAVTPPPVTDEREYSVRGADPSTRVPGVPVSATVTALAAPVPQPTITARPTVVRAAATPAALASAPAQDSPAADATPDTPAAAPGRPAAAEGSPPRRPRVTARLETPADDTLLAEILAVAACGPDGEPPSIRALMRTYAIGQKRATRLHQKARAHQNTNSHQHQNENSTARNQDTKKSETIE